MTRLSLLESRTHHRGPVAFAVQSTAYRLNAYAVSYSYFTLALKGLLNLKPCSDRNKFVNVFLTGAAGPLSVAFCRCVDINSSPLLSSPKQKRKVTANLDALPFKFLFFSFAFSSLSVTLQYLTRVPYRLYYRYELLYKQPSNLS